MSQLRILALPSIGITFGFQPQGVSHSHFPLSLLPAVLRIAHTRVLVYGTHGCVPGGAPEDTLPGTAVGRVVLVSGLTRVHSHIWVQPCLGAGSDLALTHGHNSALLSLNPTPSSRLQVSTSLWGSLTRGSWHFAWSLLGRGLSLSGGLNQGRSFSFFFFFFFLIFIYLFGCTGS